MVPQIAIPTWQKWCAALVMFIFAVPNMYYVAMGGEDFPFTCAPMFGHYIGPGTTFYNFKFIGEFPGEEKVLPSKIGRVEEIGAMRYFFSKVYGSCDEMSPFGNHPGDTPQQLEERLGKYFKSYLRVLPEAGLKDATGLQRLRLEVWRYDSQDKVDDKHVVGYYSPATEKFTHEWRNP